jgi:hypothetical protein
MARRLHEMGLVAALAGQSLRKRLECGVLSWLVVPVAQLDRASASGAEGYRFDSCRERYKAFHVKRIQTGGKVASAACAVCAPPESNPPPERHPRHAVLQDRPTPIIYPFQPCSCTSRSNRDSRFLLTMNYLVSAGLQSAVPVRPADPRNPTLRAGQEGVAAVP